MGTPADAIRDYTGSLEHQKEWATSAGLPMLSFAECQHIPGELKKYPPRGASWCTVLGVMLPPPPDRLPKFSRRRGQRGVTQPQNTELLAVGGLGNKRGILGGHEAAEEAKGCFKKKPA